MQDASCFSLKAGAGDGLQGRCDSCAKSEFARYYVRQSQSEVRQFMLGLPRGADGRTHWGDPDVVRLALSYWGIPDGEYVTRHRSGRNSGWVSWGEFLYRGVLITGGEMICISVLAGRRPHSAVLMQAIDRVATAHDEVEVVESYRGLHNGANMVMVTCENSAGLRHSAPVWDWITSNPFNHKEMHPEWCDSGPWTGYIVDAPIGMQGYVKVGVGRDYKGGPMRQHKGTDEVVTTHPSRFHAHVAERRFLWRMLDTERHAPLHNDAMPNGGSSEVCRISYHEAVAIYAEIGDELAQCSPDDLRLNYADLVAEIKLIDKAVKSNQARLHGELRRRKRK